MTQSQTAAHGEATSTQANPGRQPMRGSRAERTDSPEAAEWTLRPLAGRTAVSARRVRVAVMAAMAEARFQRSGLDRPTEAQS